MAHLNDFIKRVINDGIARKTSHEESVNTLIKKIAGEEKSIVDNYSKIGELYVKQHPDDKNGELGEMVQQVVESEKTIKNSKLKIAETLGFNFCQTCCQEVDEDALYCNNCGAKMPVKLMPGMVLCPHCNKAVREGIRFCTNCGHSMLEEAPEEKEEEKNTDEKYCPNCGWTTNDMSLMFCDACGRRLEGGEEEEAAEAVEQTPVKQVCPNCGNTVVAAGVAFCEACGRRMEPAEEE